MYCAVLSIMGNATASQCPDHDVQWRGFRLVGGAATISLSTALDCHVIDSNQPDGNGISNARSSALKMYAHQFRVTRQRPSREAVRGHRTTTAMADLVPPSTKETNLFTNTIVNPDGTVTRPEVPLIPPSPEPSPGKAVLSRDVPLDAALGTYIRLYLPAAETTPAKLPVILYFHGGGFVVFSVASFFYHGYCEAMSAAVPAIVASLEYRLAPEHRLPAAYGDAVRGLLLHQPYLGGVERTASEAASEDDGMLPLEANDKMWRLALPVGADRDHEFCNPVKSLAPDALAGLPRCLVTGNIADPLIDRQREFAAWLRHNGVEVVAKMDSKGYHAAELFVPHKTKELCDAVRDFIFADATDA